MTEHEYQRDFLLIDYSKSFIMTRKAILAHSSNSLIVYQRGFSDHLCNDGIWTHLYISVFGNYYL